MKTNATRATKRLHPHKFLLWIAMGSICMMFAGLTSAYIVKKEQSNFLQFDLPKVFWISTFVILASSLSIHLAQKAFKARQQQQYKSLITVTAILGIAFALLQVYGFADLKNHGIQLTGAGSNAAASFILVIVGLHALHVLGGVVALLVTFFRAIFASRIRNYSAVPIELMSTYWHFVDILWLYLIVFFLFIR